MIVDKIVKFDSPISYAFQIDDPHKVENQPVTKDGAA